MNSEKLFIIDPYNDTHLRMLSDFEKKYNIDSGIGQELETIKKTTKIRDYLAQKRKTNNVDEVLFLEESAQIKDYCHIKGVKDMKLCNIIISSANTKATKRKIIKKAVDYVKSLGMVSITINVPSTDKYMQTTLEKMGFENLGAEKYMTMYLLEEQKNIKNQRKI